MDATVQQLELVSAERSASLETHTCRSGPAASTLTNQRCLKFQLPVPQTNIRFERMLSRKGEGKWFNPGAGALLTREGWKAGLLLAFIWLCLEILKCMDFSYNNTQAIGVAELNKQWCKTGWGNWK